jgi:uncharacterized damage-inducible protein DinB
MSFNETIISQLKFSQWAAEKNLDGITHEESVVRPSGGANDGNWILGHIIAVRNKLLPMVGEQAIWDDARIGSYVMPSTDDTSGRLPFDELRQAFTSTHEKLVAGIARLDDATLAQKAPFSPGGDPNETVQSLLTKVVVHESYHTGQLGIARHAMGKKGAIRVP